MIKKIIILLKTNQYFYIVFSGLVFSYLIAFASNVILARFLQPNDYGLFFSLLTLVAILANLAVSGIPLYIQDQLSKKKTIKKN